MINAVIRMIPFIARPCYADEIRDRARCIWTPILQPLANFRVSAGGRQRIRDNERGTNLLHYECSLKVARSLYSQDIACQCRRRANSWGFDPSVGRD